MSHPDSPLAHSLQIGFNGSVLLHLYYTGGIQVSHAYDLFTLQPASPFAHS